MIKRIGVLFLLIISMFYLSGCEFFPSDEKGEITISKIEVDESTVLSEYVVGEVDLSKIKLIVYTSNGKKKNIVLSEDYINSLDLQKLNVIGTHNISIEYEGKKIDLTITIKDKHVHIESEWIIENEATCELDGLKYKECVDCKERLDEEVIEKLGHDLTEYEELKPTCTEKGHNAYEECSRCDYTTYEEVEAIGHSYSEWFIVTEATCLENGLEKRECENCSHFEEKVIERLGHDLTEYEELKPTCTEKGHNAYEECSRCSYTTYEEVEAKGHSYEASFEWTDYECEITLICTNDNNHKLTSSMVIKSEVIKEATCTVDGIKKYIGTFSYEGITFSDTKEEVIEKLGHSLTEYEELKPTCTEKGHNTYEECSRCSYTTYEEVEALGHDIAEYEELKPTCLEKGHNAYEECSRCSYTTYEEIKALGHNYSLEWNIDIYPTESSVGTKSHHCLNYGCDSKIDEKEIPMHPYTDGLNYTLSSSKNAYIVTDIGECTEGYINITPEYNGLSVIGIGESAFSGYTSLEGIIIPYSVKSISEYAFYNCTSLTNITIPESVISIGEHAFANCENLESITIPDSVINIFASTFLNCKNLKYTCDNDIYYLGNSENPYSILVKPKTKSNAIYKINKNTKVISGEAFSHIGLMKSITIPEGVTSIGSSAFYNCTRLTSITIPSSVTNIGSSVFEDCDSLESISIPFVGATLDGTSNTFFGYIFGADVSHRSGLYVPASLKEVVITGERISDHAFDNCVSLESITISTSVTIIGDYAFDGCTSLISITIPSSVTSIGNYAFGHCTSLESIIIPKSVTKMGRNVFSDCSSLKTIYCEIESGYILPNGWHPDWNRKGYYTIYNTVYGYKG